MSENVVAKVNNLSYKIGHRYLLRNINWTIKQGEHWLIFGMNGCGKTTLLSIIAGFQKQTSGTVEVFGEEYNAHNVLSLRKKVGWVSSSFFDKYYTSETVFQIVLSGIFGTFGIQYNVTDENIILVLELLKRLNLSDKADRPFNKLSKGERQNVLIARALVGRPNILVLDEPGTGLDVLAREMMFSLMRDLALEDTTILYVTHYPEEILNIFQNCLLLKNGQIYAKGNTENIMISENLSAFLEYPVTVSKTMGKIQFDMAIDTEIKELLYNQ